MEKQEKKQTRTLDIMYDDIPNITNLRKLDDNKVRECLDNPNIKLVVSDDFREFNLLGD